MFTDIPAFTGMSLRSAEDLPDLLKKYKAYLVDCVKEIGGILAHTRTDKSLSLYESAESAIAAAVLIRDTLKEKIQIPIRIGIHKGEVQFIEDEVIGDSLNTTLRICSIAVEGSIIVSENVYDTIQGNTGFSFRRLGFFRLKHTPEPLMLYSSGVVGDDLPGRDMFRDDISISDNSIAVLPFRDLSPEQDQEYLGHGFGEEVINNLSRLKGLKVTARTSSFAIAKKGMDIKEIGLALGVSHILEGSVRRSGNSLKLNTQMINAQSGFNELSLSFNREFGDIFRIQEELSVRIAEMLQEKFDLGADKTRLQSLKSNNIDAYDLYLKGKFELSKGSRESLEKGINTFKSIIRTDPGYSPALAGLARCYLTQGILGFIDRDLSFSLADAAVQKARELDPDMPEHMISFLLIEFWRGGWNLPKYYETITSVLKAFPGSSELRMFYAMYFLMMGNREQSLIEIRLAHELDPFSTDIRRRMIRVHFAREEYEESLEICDKLSEEEPGNNYYSLQKAWIMAFSGQLRESLAIFAEFSESEEFLSYWLSGMAYVTARSGEVDRAIEYLEKLKAMAASGDLLKPDFHLAIAYSGIRNNDMVFYHMEKGLKSRDFNFLFIRSDPMWKEYRSDERYERLIRETFRGRGTEHILTLTSETHEELEINLDDLYYISAEDNYSRVHWLENDRMREKLLRITLKNIEQQFTQPEIVRCHRSYIINLSQEFRIEGDASGYRLSSPRINEKIPISRSRGKEITSRLKLRHS